MNYLFNLALRHFGRFPGFYLAVLLHVLVFTFFMAQEIAGDKKSAARAKSQHYLKIDLGLLNTSPVQNLRVKSGEGKKHQPTTSKNTYNNDTATSGNMTNSSGVIEQVSAMTENNFENSIDVFEEPVYPIVARKNGLEGEIYLRLEVNGEGVILNHTILKSSGHNVLDKAVLNVLPKWRFLKKAVTENYFVNKTIIFKIR